MQTRIRPPPHATLPTHTHTFTRSHANTSSSRRELDRKSDSHKHLEHMMRAAHTPANRELPRSQPHMHTQGESCKCVSYYHAISGLRTPLLLVHTQSGHVGAGSHLEGMCVILLLLTNGTFLNVFISILLFAGLKSKFSDVCSRPGQSAGAALIPLLLINRACVSSRNSHMVSNHTVHVLRQHKDWSPEQELQAGERTTWAVTGGSSSATLKPPPSTLRPCCMHTDICLLIHSLVTLKGSAGLVTEPHPGYR